MPKGKKNKSKVSQKPSLSVVVPFPEDRVVIDRSIENLIRRLRRGKLKKVFVLGVTESDEYYQTNNGVTQETAAWLFEMGKLDVFGLLDNNND